MSKQLLNNLRKSVWQKAFPKTSMPSKWRNNHAKDLQNKIYKEIGQLLDTRILLKFGSGKLIDNDSLNFLAKYVLFEKKSNNSAKKTDYWQQFQNKILGVEEVEFTAKEEETPIEDTTFADDALQEQTKPHIPLPEGYRLAKFTKNLTANDLFEFPPSSDFYWKRPIDEKLSQALQNDFAVWVEGAALAGKSRAVLEALKGIEDGLLVLPDLQNLQAEMSLPPIVDGKKTVVYFDNLLNYYKNYPHQTWMVNRFLSQLLAAESVQVVVSNRIGKEAVLLADYLPDDLLQKFKKITIPTITFDDIEQFQMDVDVRLDFNAFDDSIGSLLMNLSNVQKKYEQLENMAELGWNVSQKVADTAQDILFALKHLHYIGHFHGQPNHFKISLVKDFCLRLQGRKISQKQWQEALELLELLQQKTVRFLIFPSFPLRRGQGGGLGARGMLGEEVLKVNTVYLDRAIDGRLANSDIVRKVKEFYTTVEQRLDNGFFLHPLYFSKRIYAQQFFAQAKQLLEKAVQEGLQANAAVLTSLLRKAPDFGEARILLGVRSDVLEPTPAPPKRGFSALDTKRNTSLSTSIPLLGGVRGGLSSWRIQPDSILFEVWLSKTTNYEQASQVYAALKGANVRANLTFFNHLMAKSETYEQVLDLMNDLEKAKITPSIDTFNALISKAENYEQVLQWRQKMKAADCKPNLQTFLYVLQQSPDFEVSKEVWKEMKAVDFTPSSSEFYHLYLQQASNLSEALEVKKEIETNESVDLDIEVFNILLMFAENEAQVEAFRKEIDDLKLQPNTATFSVLIAQAMDFEAALDLLKEMSDFRIKASTNTYNALLQQSADLNGAISVFEQMHEQQIDLNEDSFLILLGKTEGFEEGLKLLIQLQHAGYKAGQATYNRLITRTQTIQSALQALRKMRQNGTTPNAETYQLLIERLNEGNFKQAFNLFKAMKGEYVRPTEEVYQVLLEKIGGYEQAFVNQVLRLYPQTLADVDYHRIFAAILPEIDRHAFLKTAEEYIERDEEIKRLYF